MVQYGYNSNGFLHHRLEDALPWLAELGYTAVAITPDVPHLDPRYVEAGELRRVGARCRELGLAVVVESGARFVLDPRRKHRPNLLEADESRQLRLKYLRHLVEWCELLGAPILSFWSGVLPEGSSFTEAQERFADGVEQLAVLADRRGVKLALEPEPDHLIETLEDWRAFDAAHPGLVGLTLDVGHLLVTGEAEPAAALRAHRERILNVHLDDMPRGLHRHCPPGEGDVDFTTLGPALAALPPETPACWELSRDSHRFHELAPALVSMWTPPAGSIVGVTGD